MQPYIRSDWFLDVWDLHEDIGGYIESIPRLPPVNVKELRLTLIKEEIAETLLAIEDNNIPEIAAGIVDSIVVLLGTAISYGIDVRPIWDEVHKTNMAKKEGKTRADGKQLKPIGINKDGFLLMWKEY